MRILYVFFTFIVWVRYLCTLNNTFHFIRRDQCKLILQYLSSLKKFTILTLYYFKQTNEEICVMTYRRIKLAWTILLIRDE